MSRTGEDAVEAIGSAALVTAESDLQSPRWHVVRSVAVFQVKLAADGLRDLILSPLSLVAGLVGLVIGGRDADVPFRQVLAFGARTERWIDLFGTQREARENAEETSLDMMAEKIEELVRADYRNGGISAATRARVDELLKGFARRHGQQSGHSSRR